ncbi:MAG: 4Fe-4S binding protein [Deltaproteobacteria bacterium]|nr:4Fe-4S binding protein [Deltaproteobacteria bacterium]
MEKNRPQAGDRRPPEETTTTREIPTITVFQAWCKRCGICVAFCPQQVLAMDENRQVYAKQPEKCIACHMCELRCPDFAITVQEPEPALPDGRSGGKP